MITMRNRAWQHPWLRIGCLIRLIGYTRWDKTTRPLAKDALKRAVAERKKIRKAGWMN